MKEVDQVLLINRVCDEFESKLKTGEEALLESFVESAAREFKDEELVQSLLSELIALEILYGDDKEAVANSLRSRFPKQAKQIKEALKEGSLFGTLDDVRNGTLAENQLKSHVQVELDEGRATHTASQMVGPYKLLSKLGEGGMGTVWKAEQSTPVKRLVALKLIKPSAGSSQVIARFEAERQALAMMDHPNIAKILFGGTTDNGQPYFVMELVQGAPLTEYCDSNKLSIEQRLRLFIPVCKAVQHAHQKGIIHRDLKPSNVLVTVADGEAIPKVIDFGLAKAAEQTVKLTNRTMLTEYGSLVGSLRYMSPEQAELGQSGIDTRTDVYSLGVMLYELLTGSTPLQNQTIEGNPLLDVLEIIRNDQPLRPSSWLKSIGQDAAAIGDLRQIKPARLQQILAGELDWVVMKALESNRSRRYETAIGLADEIQRFQNDEAVLARPPSTAYRVRKFIQKNKGLVASLATISALLIAGIFGTTWFAIESSRVAKRAVIAENLAKENAEQSEKDKKEAERSSAGFKDALNVFADSFESIAPVAGGSSEMTAKDVLYRAKQRLKDSSLQDEGKAQLLSKLSLSFFGLGEVDAAIESAQEEVEIRKRIFGEQDSRTIKSLTNLENCYLRAHKNEEAIALNGEIFRLKSEVLGESHAETLLSKTNLAVAYFNKGETKKAHEINLELLEIVKDYRSLEHPDTILLMGNLASSYLRTGQIDESVKLFEELKEVLKRTFGEDHPEWADHLNGLGTAYMEQEQYEKAGELFDEVIDRFEPKLGEFNPMILASKANLAECYFRQDQKDRALSLFKVVFEPVESKMPESSEAMLVMNRLATLYEEIAKFDSAIEVRKKLVALKREQYGPDHLSTILECGHLSTAYLKAGDREKSIELREQIVAGYTRHYGADDSMVIAWQRSLASNYLNSSRYHDAIRIHNEHLKIFRKLDDLEQLEDTQLRIAHCSYRLKRYDDASRLRLQVYEQRKKRLGVHADTLSAMRVLAAGYRNRHQWDLAYDLYPEVVSWSEKLNGEEDSKTALAKLYLGEVLIQKDSAKAIGVLNDTYESWKKINPDGYRIHQSRSMLGEAQLLEGDFEAARVNLQEADASLRGNGGIKIPRNYRERMLRKSRERLEKLAELSKNQDVKERLEKED